ncbi:PadR family transcriptional regulator [Streptomyces sp. NPDC088736]|uniref:PadR family transcriptional regulator n=1 Tax=Streptomyces sp. NPDC088736 TaxID=3365881 RepID=UPI00382BCC02
MSVLWDVPLAEVEWADGTASHAVFALLTERSSHGCELRAQFEETIGPQWGGLNIGHLYQILERLVRDGYVTRSQVAQADRPDKTLYTLTPAGRAELQTWATTAWVRATAGAWCDGTRVLQRRVAAPVAGCRCRQMPLTLDVVVRAARGLKLEEER